VNFDLSDEQRLLQETLRAFTAKECPESRVRELFDAAPANDPALWKGLAELGLTGLLVPEAYGGAGLALLDAVAAAEVLGESAMPGPWASHTIACLAIALAGSEAQKQRWLPRLASGEALATLAFAEAGERWQPNEWQLAPSGGALRGEKLAAPAASAADVIVVGLAGAQLALVDASSGGVACEAADAIDRTRPFSHVRFANAPCEMLSGGSPAAERVRDAALVVLASDAQGGAARCVALAVAYAKQREQFGATIGHFQALKHQLANLALESEPNRPLVWYAAHAWDRAQADAPLVAAHAKAHVTDAFVRIARGAVEAHGGIAYTWEFPLHWWLKRALYDRAWLGSPRVHRLRAADLNGW
jgi:alkylation response protein AidB-like acyl-CoA dehydrogenase